MPITVSSLVPDSGFVGDVLVITGTNLNLVAYVGFGCRFGCDYEKRASFSLISSTELHVTVPNACVGSLGDTIGSGACETGAIGSCTFHYLIGGPIHLYEDCSGVPCSGVSAGTFTPNEPGGPPLVTSVSLATGAHGDRVDIVGGGFTALGTYVAFNGVGAEIYVVDDENIIAWVPPGTPAEITGDITVGNYSAEFETGFPFTAYRRQAGTPYDHQQETIPTRAAGPARAEQFESIPILSEGAPRDFLLEGLDGGSDSLALTDDIDSFTTFPESVSDSLGLTESIEDAADTLEEVSDDFDLTESNHLVWPVAVASAFDLSDTIDSSDLRDLLTLTDDIDDSISTKAESDFDLTDETTVAASYLDSVSDDFDLDEGAFAFVVRPGVSLVDKCDPTYLASAPMLLLLDVEFSWDVLSVTVKAPEFGNSIQLDTGAEVRKLRAGAYSIIRPDEWPNVRVLKMLFTGLSNAKVVELVNFLDQSSGREITFRDHENVTWAGVVLDQEVDIVRGKPDCNNEVAIEFRGVRT